MCFVQGYTFDKYSYQNRRERISAQKLSSNQTGVFHYSKRILSFFFQVVSALCGRFLFVRFKINSTPGIFSPFLSATEDNFTSHKALFQTPLFQINLSSLNFEGRMQ